MKKYILFLMLFWCNIGFSQVYKTIHLNRPGLLSQELTQGELETVTDLTISGKIDARDFKTMRNQMPELRNINIKNVIIVKYYGKFGTYIYDEISYPANEIPIYSTSKKIKTLVLPNSLKSIGEYAFKNCDSLTNIIIPEGVKRIGSFAFDSCIGLTSIIIPENTDSIGRRAFANCTGLTSINIPKSKERFGKDRTYEQVFGNYNYIKRPPVKPIHFEKELSETFANCTGLKSVTLPADSNLILTSTFCGCTGLDSVFIPVGVKLFATFFECSNLEKVTFSPDITEIGYGAFGGCSKLNSINMPLGTKTIYPFAFENTGIKQVVIPNSVINIGRNAFSNCPLESIYVPKSVKSIAEIQFMDYGKLIDIFIDNENSAFSKRNGVLYSKDGTQYLYCPRNIKGAYTIPDGVKEIGSQAFQKCFALTTIKTPMGVSAICDNAFDSCTNLCSVELPNSVEKIGNYAFANCERLEYVKFPNNLKYIGNSAFIDCINLRTIKMPKKLNKLGASTFANCKSLCGTILIPGNIDTIRVATFSNCPNLRKVILKKGVRCIEPSVFSNCENLKTIKIPNSLNRIEYDGIVDCRKLKSITIPKNTICANSFRGCDSLVKINLYQTNPDYYKVIPLMKDYERLKIIVPLCSYWKYKNDFRWKYYKIAPRIFSFNIANWFIKEVKKDPKPEDNHVPVYVY